MTRRTPRSARTASALLALALTAGPAAAERPAFQTPSGNILCYVDNSASVLDMTCLIRQAQWPMPKLVGDSCDMDLVRALVVAPDLDPQAIAICHSDVFWPYPAPTVSYGTTWQVEGFTCQIEQTGVTCTDSRTGRGYSVARAGYTLN